MKKSAQGSCAAHRHQQSLKEGMGALGPERLTDCPHEDPCVRPGRLCVLHSAGRGAVVPSCCGRAGSGPRASSPHLQSFRGAWPPRGSGGHRMQPYGPAASSWDRPPPQPLHPLVADFASCSDALHCANLVGLSVSPLHWELLEGRGGPRWGPSTERRGPVWLGQLGREAQGAATARSL